MAYKEVSRVEISEVIRRWRAGHSQRHIASGTGLSRDTVAKYIAAAEVLGVSLAGPEPSEEQLTRLASIGQPGPRQARRPLRTCWHPGATRSTSGSPATGCSLSASRSCLAERGCRVSYASLQRFVARRN